MFQPKYTLNGEWHDRRDEGTMPHIRAIRTLTNRLPSRNTSIIEIFRDELNRISTSDTGEQGILIPATSISHSR